MDYIRQNEIQIDEVNYGQYVNVDNNPKIQAFRKEFSDLVEKHERIKQDVEDEANAFNDEMFEKYGEGWANDPERMSDGRIMSICIL